MEYDLTVQWLPVKVFSTRMLWLGVRNQWAIPQANWAFGPLYIEMINRLFLSLSRACAFFSTLGIEVH